MSTSSASAASISRITTHMGVRSLAAWALILVAAGCAQVPAPCPCPKPGPAADARYEAVAFDALPGWTKVAADDGRAVWVAEDALFDLVR